jgi:drug/metabolite transporter (DMT)-like permease
MSIGILLAVMAAVGYGAADFVGGLASRRVSHWTVAIAGQLAGGAALLVAGLSLPGSVRTEDIAWALLAGLGSAVGTVSLYRGLARGRMGVVARAGCSTAASPVSGSASSSSRSPKSPSRPACCRQPGCRSHPHADPRRRAAPTAVASRAILWRAAAWGAAGGLLGTSGTVAFLLASRTTHLAVTGVLASLYPAATVLLAAVLLRERVRPSQTLGLARCGASVCLVALG